MPVQQAGTSVDLFETFAEADPVWSPAPLWWWSGEPLDPARLRWQLERFVEGGVFNLVIMNLAPTGPLYGKRADDPPFMSERWWEIFLGVCADARELGVRLWFYDQIGFSGANIQGQILGRHPEYAGQTLERVSVTSEGPLEVECPPNGTPLSSSVTHLDRGGSAIGMPTSVPVVDRVARWEEPGPARLSLHYAAPRGFDYLNKTACAMLLDTIHGEFERHASEFFGDVIVGSFQDELSTMPRWSSGFLECFSRRHGYSLEPWFDALWDEYGGEERRIRRDFHATRASLAEGAFFKPLFDWHDARGLICGFDQQHPARTGDPKAGVDIYADYLRTHRWYSAPGSDHHGEAKIHSSLAHLYDRPRVWIESFHSSGWGGTIEETFDWLIPWLRAGANLYNPHATYYSTRGGWFEWAPPATDWRQPYWEDYRSFADAISRLCKFLSSGQHVCDVGVLYPATTVQGGLGIDSAVSDEAQQAHDMYQRLVGSMTWYDQRSGELDALGIDFDVLDDDSLAGGRAESGTLRIAAERYRVIILPACIVLERAVARTLLEFIEAGGTVIPLAAMPRYLADDSEDSDGLISGLRSRLDVHTIDALDRLLPIGDRLVEAPVPTLMRSVGEATILFVPAVTGTASRVQGWPDATVDFDRSRYPESLTIRVRGVDGAPELWNPFTLERRSVSRESVRTVEGGVEIDIAFHGASCALLVWGQSLETEISGVPESTVLEFGGPWEVEILPTLDNRWGDFAFPTNNGPFPLQRWHWDHRVDDSDEWTGVVASYGPRAWWSGPGGYELLIRDEPGAPWMLASWSEPRGMLKDPLHWYTLGPSGHVPEEFLDFGEVPAGQSVLLKTTLLVPGDVDIAGWLVIGAAARKRVWIDSLELAISPDENDLYQTAIPVHLSPGSHAFELILTVEREREQEQTMNLRASYALTTDIVGFRRPERIAAAGEPVPGTTLRFETQVVLDSDATSAVIQVATTGAARILIDGHELGRQGGFMPYGEYSATHPYDAKGLLTQGAHSLAVEIDDLERGASLLVDAAIESGSGASHWSMTDASWSVSRGGRPVPLAIVRKPRGDPAADMLRQRPHTLPGSRWLEGDAADDGSVIPVVSSAGSSRTVRLRCLLPPGAIAISIPLIAASALAEVGGELVARTLGASGEAWSFDLPEPLKLRRVLLLRIETRPGYADGAILAGPATFTCAVGQMDLKSWEAAGFVDFSGAIVYRKSFEMDQEPGMRYWLDLGDLRGSASVTLDGHSCGSAVVAPFRFDVTDALASGSTHELEIRIANTLGPYMDAVSPTRFVLEGQTRSGLFGPVRLTVERVAD